VAVLELLTLIIETMSKEKKELKETTNPPLLIADVSKSYCECSFVMIRRDQKTQKAYCFECKKEVQE
jgi:hypothetical protein